MSGRFVAATRKIEPNDFCFINQAQTIQALGGHINPALVASSGHKKHWLADDEIHQAGVEFGGSGHGSSKDALGSEVNQNSAQNKSCWQVMPTALFRREIYRHANKYLCCAPAGASIG